MTIPACKWAQQMLFMPLALLCSDHTAPPPAKHSNNEGDRSLPISDWFGWNQAVTCSQDCDDVLRRMQGLRALLGCGHWWRWSLLERSGTESVTYQPLYLSLEIDGSKQSPVKWRMPCLLLGGRGKRN